MPTTYTYTGIAAADLTTVSGNAVAVGESLVVNPNWSVDTHGMTFEFTDSNETEINGDDEGNDEVGRDSGQFLTVTDANDNELDTGLGYAEERITLEGPGGETVYVYTIEIGGEFYGSVIDGDLTPGVEYEVTEVVDVDRWNDPGYNTIDSYEYDQGADNTIEASDGDEVLKGGDGADSIVAGGGNDTLSGGSGNDTIEAGNGDDLIQDGDQTTGGSGTMTNNYSVINLGNFTDLDTDESGARMGAENADAALGTYGTLDDPVSDHLDDYYAPNATSGGGLPSVTTDNGGGTPDEIFINGQGTYIDTVLVYDATITYMDGTTATISAVVFQTTDGDLFLAPEYSYNADQEALEAGPIQSISLNSVISGDQDSDNNVLVQDRYDSELVIGDGGGGDDSIDAGAGNDTVNGGVGNDTIEGGSGDDEITGGAGDDTFAFADGSGADTIVDFDIYDDDDDGYTNDQLDVSGLTDANGDAVQPWDVVVSDDGNGNALLTFPNGETVVINGVDPATVAEEGKLHSMGIPCFTTGTMIDTPTGPVAVEDLAPGDLVTCSNGAALPVLWAGGRELHRAELDAHPELCPIEIKAGVLGNKRPLRLSAQHAVALHGDNGPVLARALHLAERGQGKFRVAKGVKSVGYHHIMLPHHALVRAEGAWVETMWPGPVAIKALGPKARLEIAMGFPHLVPALNDECAVETVYGPRACPLLKRKEVHALDDVAPVRLGKVHAIHDVQIVPVDKHKRPLAGPFAA